MKCPCDNCICVPICRHKWFDDLTQECSLIHDCLSDEDVDTRKSNTLLCEESLDPTRWYVGSELEHDHDIVYIEKDIELR